MPEVEAQRFSSAWFYFALGKEITMLAIQRFLICDGAFGEQELDCYENYGVDNPSFPTALHRKGAKAEGWHTNGTHDFCPVCWAARKEIKK